MKNVLSPSLEDYLKTIWEISLNKKVIRVKDISKKLGFKVSSIVTALNNLQKYGLIIHEKYGFIELTDKGIKRAQEIYEKHKKITKFLTDILNIDTDIAIQDACNIEHYLHKKTYENLVKFMNYIESRKDISKDWVKVLKNDQKGKPKKVGSKTMKLNELKTGEKGKIKKVTGQLKQRLLAMGILPGEIIRVEKVAPLGDPIEISIKTYHLTLRKEEAELINIEKI